MERSHYWQSVIFDADLQTALLMVQVQTADIQAMRQASNKRKRDSHTAGSDTRPFDEEVAWQIFDEELRGFRSLLPDHNFAAAIGALPHGHEEQSTVAQSLMPTMPVAQHGPAEAAWPAAHTRIAPVFPPLEAPRFPQPSVNLPPVGRQMQAGAPQHSAPPPYTTNYPPAGTPASLQIQGRPAQLHCLFQKTPASSSLSRTTQTTAAQPAGLSQTLPTSNHLPPTYAEALQPADGSNAARVLPSRQLWQAGAARALLQTRSAPHTSLVDPPHHAKAQDCRVPPVQTPDLPNHALEHAMTGQLICTGCTTNVKPEEVFKTPCGHCYCNECMDRLHSACLLDERLFPPRCCRLEIPWEAVQDRLSPPVKAEFEIKRVELQTKDRVYCHNPTCSAFLPPMTITGRQARCPTCLQATCVQCKAAYHFGACAEDPHMAALLLTAEQNHWRSCPSCHRMIELKSGCFHITCVCRAQFCYSCGRKWRTCRCRRWDEMRLVERAQVVIDRREAAPVQRQDHHPENINQVVDQVRRRHCAHDDLQRLDRPGQMLYCGDCGIAKRDWMWACNDCGAQRCNTCRAAAEDEDEDDCDHEVSSIYREPGRNFICEECEVVKWNWMNVCDNCDAYLCNDCSH